MHASLAAIALRDLGIGRGATELPGQLTPEGVDLCAVWLAVDLAGIEGGANEDGPRRSGHRMEVKLGAELIQARQAG